MREEIFLKGIKIYSERILTKNILMYKKVFDLLFGVVQLVLDHFTVKKGFLTYVTDSGKV